MASRIENLTEWAHNLLGTLDRQVAITRDARLRELLDEVRNYPNVAALDATWRTRSTPPAVLVPLQLRVGDQMQSWFSMNTSIGTPVDITLDGAPCRAVPSRRRGNRGDGRRPPNALACTVMEVSVTSDASEEEIAAITAAIEALWPRPVAAAANDTRRPSVWRFSGRWWSQPIPLRRPRPWV